MPTAPVATPSTTSAALVQQGAVTVEPAPQPAEKPDATPLSSGKVSGKLPDAKKNLTRFQRLKRRIWGEDDGLDYANDEPTVKVEIQGKAIPEALADNLRAYLRRITISELTDFQATIPRARSLAKEAAEAVGYYQSQFIFSAKSGNTLVVDVVPGDAVTVRTNHLVFLGGAENDEKFKAIENAPDIKVGDTLNHEWYEKLKARILNQSTERGYFEGIWYERDVKVTLPTNTADIRLVYDSGDRYKFGAIQFKNATGDPQLPVRLDLLKQLLPFHTGDAYDATQVAQLTRNLQDTRWFNNIKLDVLTPDPLPDDSDVSDEDLTPGLARARDLPSDSALLTPDKLEETGVADQVPDRDKELLAKAESLKAPSRAEVIAQAKAHQAEIARIKRDQTIPVTVTVNASRPNSAEVGIGYGTDTGARLRSQYRRALLNEDGHSIDGNFEVSKIRQAIEARYNLPYKHPLNDTLSYFGGYEHETDTQTADELRLEYQSLTLGAERSIKPVSTGWQKTISVRYRLDQLTIGDLAQIQSASGLPFHFNSSKPREQMLLFGYGLNKVHTSGGLDPVSGFRQYYQIDVGSKALLSETDMASLRAGWRWIDSFGSSNAHQLISRLDLGSIVSNDFSKVPYNQRFFAGGDQSIRGYDYKSLSTVVDGYQVGGQNLAVGSLEYTYRFLPQWRGAVFVDAGNAFDDSFNDPIKVGVGLGVRWSSPIGPIRIDVGAGVSEASIPIRLHFFIGPSL